MELSRALIVLAVVAGCGASRQPVGPTVPTAPRELPVYGHYTKVHLDGERRPVEGELIAVEGDAIVLRTGSAAMDQAVGRGGPDGVEGTRRKREPDDEPEAVRRIDLEDTRRVTVIRYDARSATIATGAWAGGLNLLTLSHGWFVVITLPVSVVVGATAVTATHVQSRVYVRRRKPFEDFVARVAGLRRFARFPQGAPAGWPKRERIVDPDLPAPLEPPSVDARDETAEAPEPAAPRPSAPPVAPPRIDPQPVDPQPVDPHDEDVPRDYEGPSGIGLVPEPPPPGR